MKEYSRDLAKARCEAIDEAVNLLANAPLFLDTETTGLGPEDEIIEIAIINADGHALLDTLVKPLKAIPYGAYKVNGISDAMVETSPPWEEVWPLVKGIIGGMHVGIYNAEYDHRLICSSSRLHGIDEEPEYIQTCILDMYSAFVGDWDSRRQRWRRHKLEQAIEDFDITITGKAHRAVSDAMAAMAVALAIAADTPSRYHGKHVALPTRHGGGQKTSDGASHPQKGQIPDAELSQAGKAMRGFIGDAMRGNPTVVQFAERLETLGVTPKVFIAKSGKVNGFRFEMDGESYSGFELGHKWSLLQKAGVNYDQERDHDAMTRFMANGGMAPATDEGKLRLDVGKDGLDDPLAEQPMQIVDELLLWTCCADCSKAIWQKIDGHFAAYCTLQSRFSASVSPQTTTSWCSARKGVGRLSD